MKIGITGHQERPGIDWSWVRNQIEQELKSYAQPVEGLSSLAKGADQVFADSVFAIGGSLTAIIPIVNYEKYFKGLDAIKYQRLLLRSKVVHMTDQGDDQESFLAAGLYIADHCDALFAVWDGKPAQGRGGTADIVDHAINSKKGFIHLNPFDRKIERLYA